MPNIDPKQPITNVFTMRPVIIYKPTTKKNPEN